jgi:type VI secretion system secreted protein VgrG
MPSTLTQKNRRLGIKTELGDDALLVTRAVIKEQLGRLFQIEVEMSAEDNALDFNSLVGTSATVWMERPDGNKRYFNGLISRFSQPSQEGRLACYKATLVPWLWFLTRAADCRIFQNKTATDIIEDVFKAQGFDDYKLDLTGTYREREYCVQYRESDFNFVSRLMEQEGIYYYFEHEDGKHTLALTDAASSHSEYDTYSSIEYRPRPKAGSDDGENISDWVVEMEVQTGAYVTGEFNFKTPNAPIVTNDSISRQHAHSSYEVFDYPGEFDVREEGEDYAKRRIEELQAQHEIVHGQATSRGIAAGYKFTLKDHPRSDQNQSYLVTAATFHLDSGEFESGGKPKSEEFYKCNFTAMPADEQFRSTRHARKPLIQGPQTAMVVGTSGEEIDTDEYGRVKVQFHWDRQGQSDENSSCWVRVSQPSAGKGWGAISLPRIGQEVMVEFLEGDPDRPIITGRVYNASAVVPYALPDNKTISTFISNSSKGGDGYNEFRIEDKKGSEKIYLHGEKDHDERIKNDTKEWVGNDRHLIVKNDQLEKVEGDQHLGVTGDSRLKIEGKFGETISGDHVAAVKGADNLAVTGDQKVKVDGDVNLKGGQDLNTEVEQKVSVKAGTDIHLKAGATYAMEAATTVHIKGGTVLVIEAGTQLSLKAGASFIDLGPSGVSISGTMVNINSGGSAASGSGSSPTAPTTPDSPDDPKEPKEADES